VPVVASVLSNANEPKPEMTSGDAQSSAPPTSGAGGNVGNAGALTMRPSLSTSTLCPWTSAAVCAEAVSVRHAVTKIAERRMGFMEDVSCGSK